MPDALSSPPRPEPSPSPRRAGRRPRRTDLRDEFVATAQRWHRRIISKEHWLNFLKALAWVAPLTLLIWVWAEREQSTTEPNVAFPIEVTSNDPNRIVTLLNPADKNVVADLLGPRARLDEVRQLLVPRGGGDSPPVSISVEPTLSPGRHELRTIDRLRDQDIFADRGISLKSCQPPMLQVQIEQVTERELRVEVPPTVNNLESATFDPPTVKIRGPQSLLDMLESRGASGRAVVHVDLADAQVLRTPGQHELSDVPLLRPFRDEHVSLNPPRVRAILKVKQADIEYEIASMSVFVVAPQNVLEKYKIEYDPIVTNVKVIGPPEKIELLRKESLVPKPKALLDVSGDDRGKSRPRRLRYDLPDGVTISPDDAKREITFTVSERGPGD